MELNNFLATCFPHLTIALTPILTIYFGNHCLIEFIAMSLEIAVLVLVFYK